jgi:hypothetical protein
MEFIKQNTRVREDCVSLSDKKTFKTESSDLFKESMKQTREFHEKDNGALLPQIIYDTPSKISINRDQLIILLEEEESIRQSKELLELYDATTIYDYAEIDFDIRIKALKNKLPDLINVQKEQIDWEDAIKAYSLACGEYINDTEIREKIVWMRYDKTRLGKLRVNDKIITESLYVYDMKKNKVIFEDLIDKSKPTIMVCGSMS